MRTLASFLGVQVSWFSCVLGATHGAPWIGPCVVVLVLALHLRQLVAWRHELVVLLLATLVGFLVDSALVGAGLLTIAGWHVAPPWLVALWPSFASTTGDRGLLAGLSAKPWLAAIVGALGGPLAYASGARFGALALAPTAGVVAIGLVWAAVVPALSSSARRSGYRRSAS